MNKKKLYHVLVNVRAIPHWGLLGLTIFLLVVAVFALRANNQHMLKLRGAVFVADEQNGDVETALRELREYVYAHMNTDLAAGNNAIKPPIQLEHRYERLLAAQAAAVGAENGQIYTDAQDYCEQQLPHGYSGSVRIACIENYVDSHGGVIVRDNIPADLYKFDFVSPRWSPDLAGWSLVLAGVSFVLLILRLLLEFIIKRQLHHHL